MQRHTLAGAEILRGSGSQLLRTAEKIALTHHERWDGQGYPDRLRGTEIPLGARVVAVADSFDAMTSDRPYRQGIPAQQALDILRAGRWEQWDGTVVDAFLRSIAERVAAPVESAPVPAEAATPDPGVAPLPIT
jgi:putative two-component system response regulator